MSTLVSGASNYFVVILCRWIQEISFSYVVGHLLVWRKPFQKGNTLSQGFIIEIICMNVSTLKVV